jgi:ketol-acid reductoisomerase
MATTISDKLTKVNEAFTINMYDNGFMIEVGGRDDNDEWKNTKIIVSTVEELVELVKEAASMPRD